MKDQLHDFDFDEAISIEPAFEPSDRFLKAFYLFAGRSQSLQRYFHFSSRYIAHYLARQAAAQAHIRTTAYPVGTNSMATCGM